MLHLIPTLLSTLRQSKRTRSDLLLKILTLLQQIEILHRRNPRPPRPGALKSGMDAFLTDFGDRLRSLAHFEERDVREGAGEDELLRLVSEHKPRRELQQSEDRRSLQGRLVYL